jgi:hypothetical protein
VDFVKEMSAKFRGPSYYALPLSVSGKDSLLPNLLGGARSPSRGRFLPSAQVFRVTAVFGFKIMQSAYLGKVGSGTK